MKRSDLLSQIALGEDSTRQFKVDVKNADSLAAEMAAFANTDGGVIFIGVADDGSTPGLSGHDVARINQLISNAASHLVHSPLAVQTENVGLENDRIVIVLTVPKGIDKPYFDKNGVIWLKAGADKRRVNSKEELRRLFQFTHQFHADELPTKAGIDKLDKLRFRDFLRDVYKQEYPDSPSELTRLLQNMNLATHDDRLNLAGVLLFAEQPEWIVPQFVVKAIRYLGSGIKRALEKWQDIDFVDDHEGCLFTATIHRKPVEELELLDKRMLTDQRSDLSGHSDPINDLLNALRFDPSAGYTALAERLKVSETTVKRNIQKLKLQNRIRRIGSKKTGHWEVIE